MGLYGGLDAKGIHKHKGLKKSENILDHMGSTELAANLFRATQTEEKLKRENIKGKQKANQTHFEVGKKVRKTILELGGTMPENLPVAGSIKKLDKKDELKKLAPKKNK
jgi:DNA-damage-inducible protein D